MRPLLSLGLLALLTGCSTPAESSAFYETQIQSQRQELADEQVHLAELIQKQQDAVAEAQEWNVHTFGIPASGWVGILVLVSLLVFVLLICAGVSAHNSLERRALTRRSVAIEREKTRQEAIKRGPCTSCFAPHPLAVGEVKKNA